MMAVTCVFDGQFDLGESPVWSAVDKKLWFVDINRATLHRLDPSAGTLEHWPMPSAIGSLAPAADGELIVALRDGVYRFSPLNGMSRLAPAPFDPRQMRLNDGRCDRQGRFWVGNLVDDRTPTGALYRLDGTVLQPEPMVRSLAVSNGLAWSPDGRTMYHADTPSLQVFAYDYDPATGRPSNRRLFIDLGSTGERPDGAAVDAAGNYWLALYGAGRIVQFSPAGLRLRDVTLPVKAPTMPCFGGADLRDLYITSARQKHSPDELAAMPLAGGIFMIRVDVPGLPEPAFTG